MLYGIEFRTKKSAIAYVYLSLSPPPPEWSWGLERLIQLKYYVVLKRQITINLGFNIAKNTQRIKKSIKWKIFNSEKLYLMFF